MVRVNDGNITFFKRHYLFIVFQINSTLMPEANNKLR